MYNLILLYMYFFFFFLDNRGCPSQLTRTLTNSTGPYRANSRVNTPVPPRGLEPVTSGYSTLELPLGGNIAIYVHGNIHYIILYISFTYYIIIYLFMYLTFIK